MQEYSEKVAAHWSGKRNAPSYNWWSNHVVVKHVNKLVCGQAISGLSAGIHKLASEKCSLLNIAFDRGVSVGCGIGSKEFCLLQQGIVSHMTCYDLSPERLKIALVKARALGLENKITFHLGDPFEILAGKRLRGSYDFVYWNNSLHHMQNTYFALEWTRLALQGGGLLVMDEYVGPNRIQFTDQMLDFANRVRSSLPRSKCCYPGVDPKINSRQPRPVVRPDIDRLIAKDPSEAPDSENIMPSLVKIFPNAEICRTGGRYIFAVCLLCMLISMHLARMIKAF